MKTFIFICQFGPLILTVIVCNAALYLNYDGSNKQLTEIPKDIPSDVNNISLQRNYFETIPGKAFTIFRALLILDLSHNRISSVGRGAFDGCTLRKLDLRANVLTAIPYLDSIGHSLEILDMDNNLIQGINRSTFTHLINLRYINVEFNRIHKLLPDTFLEMAPTVKSIHLSANFLQQLTIWLPSNMSNLVTMHMESNCLHSFPDFSHLPSENNLKSVYLWNNKLENIPANALSKLTQLRRIELSNNQLSQVPNFTHQKNSLIYLGLARNRISKPKYDAFSGLVIGELTMDSNGMRELPNLYPLRTTITHLYMSHNNFEAVPGSDLLMFLQPLTKLTTLWIANSGLETFPDIRLLNRSFELLGLLNPHTMVCNCSISWLKEASALKRIKWLDVNNNSYVCALPDSFKHKRWGEITKEQLCPGIKSKVKKDPVFKVISNVGGDRDEIIIAGLISSPVMVAILTLIMLVLWVKRRHIFGNCKMLRCKRRTKEQNRSLQRSPPEENLNDEGLSASPDYFDISELHDYINESENRLNSASSTRRYYVNADEVPPSCDDEAQSINCSHSDGRTLASSMSTSSESMDRITNDEDNPYNNINTFAGNLSMSSRQAMQLDMVFENT